MTYPLLRKQRPASRPAPEQPAAIHLHLVGEHPAERPENSTNTRTVRCRIDTQPEQFTHLYSGRRCWCPRETETVGEKGSFVSLVPLYTKISFKMKYYQ